MNFFSFFKQFFWADWLGLSWFLICWFGYERLVEKGVVREHYFRLSDIIRRYIENRFSIPAVEQTTQELLPGIMRLAGMNDAAKSGMQEFLQHSDMVKFAKYLPGQEEIESSEQKVVRIIQETKKEEAPPETEKTV